LTSSALNRTSAPWSVAAIACARRAIAMCSLTSAWQHRLEQRLDDLTDASVSTCPMRAIAACPNCAQAIVPTSPNLAVVGSRSSRTGLGPSSRVV
jgi:hypothetical protein